MFKTVQNSYGDIADAGAISSNRLEIFFDGLCQPYNPGGVACYAFIIKRQGKPYPKIIRSEFGLATEPFTDNATNNVAEYTGIIKALEWLLQQRQIPRNNYDVTESIVIKGDSQLVIYQIKGRYKVKALKIIPLYQKVISLISKFDDIHFEWIPREKNSEADKLSNYAY